MGYSTQQWIICGSVIVGVIWYFNQGQEKQREPRFEGGGFVGGERFYHPSIIPSRKRGRGSVLIE